MDAPIHDPRDDSIPDLVGRLIEDGRNYARAEIGLYKEIARHRAGRARNGLIALVAGGVLLWFALTAFVIGAVIALAGLIGPLLAGIAIAALFAAAGYVAVRYGLAGMRALSGDEAEREALARGESER